MPEPPDNSGLPRPPGAAPWRFTLRGVLLYTLAVAVALALAGRAPRVVCVPFGFTALIMATTLFLSGCRTWLGGTIGVVLALTISLIIGLLGESGLLDELTCYAAITFILWMGNIGAGLDAIRLEQHWIGWPVLILSFSTGCLCTVV